MIAIIDYGVGNLFSLQASLKKLGIEAIVTNDEAIINSASHIILPGVGAFGDAARILRESGLVPCVMENAKKKPMLGICVGMQLLFERGFEFGVHEGLGLIEGDIVAIKDDLTTDLKVPHMGWNKLKFTQDSPIFANIKENDAVYFVHSFHAKTKSDFITSTAEYEVDITSSVQKGNIFGTQFHPEKSGSVGLNILKAFYDYKGDLK